MHERKLFVLLRLGLGVLLLLGLAWPGLVLAQSGIQVIINSISVSSIPGRSAYQVSAYLSPLDTNGNPIRSIAQDKFAVMVDSQPVNAKLEEAVDDPISVVLVMDTSGSMSGTPLAAAKKAAQAFVESLGPQDKSALISFDKAFSEKVSFTSTKAQIISAIQGLAPQANSGTCLYDAAYHAVEMANLLPPGRRAVVILTDGEDETPDQSKPCSSYKLDDVVELASNPVSHVPIYTIGLGADVGNSQLKRMANLSGGNFLASPRPEQLMNIFQVLFDQLRFQYKLSYESETIPGPHLLLVRITTDGGNNQDTQEFIIPETPVSLAFSRQAYEANSNDLMKVEIALFGKSNQVTSVTYSIDSKKSVTVKKAPYNTEIDLSGLSAGQYSLIAQAYDANGKELAKTSVKLTLTASQATAASTKAQSTSTKASAAPIAATAVQTPAVTKTTKPGEGGLNTTPQWLILAIVGGIVFVVVVLVIFFVYRTIRNRKQRQIESVTRINNMPAYPTMIPAEYREMDEQQPEPQSESRSDPRLAPWHEPKPEPLSGPGLETRLEPRPEPKSEPWPEPRPEPRLEPKPEPRSEPKPVSRPEPKPDPKPVPISRPVPKPEPVEHRKEPFGLITVVHSDDPARIGDVFEITGEATTIGRSDKNDLSFPKDNAVSRQHVILEFKAGQFTVAQVPAIDGDGTRKWPTYGTFVKENELKEDSKITFGVDTEIRLGKRLRLRVVPRKVIKKDDPDATFDNMAPTMDVDATNDRG
jgi:VWFA-related protein